MFLLTKPCRIWPGYIAPPTGYGVKRVGMRMVRAHRWAYCQHHGLPLSAIDGVVIRHKCDVKACVEPEHLEPGTHADNIADKVARGRQARGETHTIAKLSADQVMFIRRVYKARDPEYGAAALGRLFNVDRTTIGKIASGVNWRHILQ